MKCKGRRVSGVTFLDMTNTTANRPLAVTNSSHAPHLAFVCESCWAEYSFAYEVAKDKSEVAVRSDVLGGFWRLDDSNSLISGGSTGESFADVSGSAHYNECGKFAGYEGDAQCIVCAKRATPSVLFGEVWAVPEPEAEPFAVVSDLFRVAIEVKYLGPTNSRGSRVKATARNAWDGQRGHSVTIGWDHSLDREGNYRSAVRALLVQQGWQGTWALGGTETGAVAVCVSGKVQG